MRKSHGNSQLFLLQFDIKKLKEINPRITTEETVVATRLELEIAFSSLFYHKRIPRPSSSQFDLRNDVMRHSSRQVLVDDVNDCDPVFTRTTYETSIEENTYDGQHLLNVTATDADAGENARMTYAIATSDVIDLVNINSNSGRIVVRRSLDYETTKRVSNKLLFHIESSV